MTLGEYRTRILALENLLAFNITQGFLQGGVRSTKCRKRPVVVEQ